MTAPRCHGGDESGSVLAIVLLSSSVLLSLGLMLSLVSSVETDIAANAHAAVQTLALAEAAAGRAATDLSALGAWDLALSGASTAVFFDGAQGARRAGGAVIALETETAWLLCGAPACGGRPPDAMTAARPWGRNNPVWTVYASGTAEAVLGAAGRAIPGYAVVWVGDDSAENDADPRRDGGPPVAEARSAENPGAGAMVLRAVAWGARGSRRELELMVERGDPVAGTGLRIRVWREVRGALP